MAEISVKVGSSSGTAAGSAAVKPAQPIDPQQARVARELLTATRDVTSELEKQAKKLAQIQSRFEAQRDLVSELSDSLSDVDLDALFDSAGGLEKAATSARAAVKSVGREGSKSGEAISAAADRADATLKKMAGAAGGAGLAILAFKALANAVSGLASLFGSALDLATGLVSSVVEIGKSILSIPIRAFEGFVALSNEVAPILVEIETAVEGIRKQFGDLRGPVSSTVRELGASMKGFSATGLSAWGVVGDLAQRLDYARELATEMGPVFGKLRAEFVADGGAIVAFQKGLGMAGDELRGVGELAIVEGRSIRRVLTEITGQAIDLGSAFSVDSKIISRDVGHALKDVGRFGGATVKEIARASVYARKLGVELDRIAGTLSAFETFDSAAENAAKLTQSFGVLVDAFSLMEAQTPDEQIDALRKSFFAAGRTAEGMTRQELKLLSQTVGLDEATTRVVFSMQNQAASLDLLKKKGEEAGKKQLTQAEALAKLAASIERLVRQGPEFAGFFDAMLKGFSRGVMTSGPFTRSVFDLRNALMAVWREGGKLGRSFVDLFPGVKTLLEGISELFKPDRFRRFAAEFRKHLEGFFRELATGKHSFGELMTRMRRSFFDFLSAETPGGRQIVEGAKTFLLTLGQAIADGIEWAVGALERGIRFLAEFVRDPSGAVERLGGALKSSKSFAAELFSPIVKALTDKTATNGLFSAVEELLDSLKLKIGRKLEETFLDVKEEIVRSIELTRRSSSFYLRGSRNKDMKFGGRTVSGHELDIDEDLFAARQKREQEIAAKYDVLEQKWNADRRAVSQKKTAEAAAADAKTEAAVAARAADEKIAAITDAGRSVAEARKREVAASSADLRSSLGSSLSSDPTRRARQMSDVVDSLSQIRERVKRIDAAAFKELAAKLAEIDANLKPVSDSLGTRIAATVWSVNKLSDLHVDALQNVAKIVKAGVVDQAGRAVAQIVKSAADLDAQLGAAAANKVNVAAHLKTIASALPGLGASGQHTIKNREVAVTVNLTVTMNAGEVERVILQRKDSVIRDRLDNASYQGSTRPAPIPQAPSAPPPMPLTPVR